MDARPSKGYNCDTTWPAGCGSAMSAIGTPGARYTWPSHHWSADILLVTPGKECYG
ncbi:MAG: hypothetical protein RMJ59_05180 [Candidatus Nitrosocaldus sp.]|nr:hypothetical protein [Candidatus Nitrosocaldus sp.]MDW8275754.1 hypothetical protein [Candidatus Nitrosocaldus sp.]